MSSHAEDEEDSGSEHESVVAEDEEQPVEVSAQRRRRGKPEVCVKLHIIHPWVEASDLNMTAEEVKKGIRCEDLFTVADYYNRNFATDEASARDILCRFGDGLLRYLSQDEEGLTYHMCLALFMKLTEDRNGMSNKNSFMCLVPAAVRGDNHIQLARGVVSQVDGTKETERKVIRPVAWYGFDPTVFPTAMYIRHLSEEIKRLKRLSREELEMEPHKLKPEDFKPFQDFFDMLKPLRHVYNNDSELLALGRYSMKYLHRNTDTKYFIVFATNNPKNHWNNLGSLGGIEMQMRKWINVEALYEMQRNAQTLLATLLEKNSKTSLQIDTTRLKHRGSRKRVAADIDSDNESGGQTGSTLDVSDKPTGPYMMLSKIVSDILSQENNRPEGLSNDHEMKWLMSIRHDFKSSHPLRIHAENLENAEINSVSNDFLKLITCTLEKWNTTVQVLPEDPATVIYREAPSLLHGILLSDDAFTNLCKVRNYARNLARDVSTHSTTFVAICMTIPQKILRRSIVTILNTSYDETREKIVSILRIILNSVKEMITVEFVTSMLYSLSYFIVHSMQEWATQMNKFDLPREYSQVTSVPLRQLIPAKRLQAEIDSGIPRHVIMDPAMVEKAEARVHTISFYPHMLIQMNTKWTVGADKKKCLREHVIFVASVESSKQEKDRKASGVLTTTLLPLGVWKKKLFKEEGGLDEQRKIPRSKLDPKSELILEALNAMIEKTFPTTRRNPGVPWSTGKNHELKTKFMYEYVTDIAYNATQMVFYPSDNFYAGMLPQDVQDLIYGEEGFNQAVWREQKHFSKEFERFMGALGGCPSVSSIWNEKFTDTNFKAIMFLANIPAYSLDREHKTVHLARIPVMILENIDGNTKIKMNPRYMHFSLNEPTHVAGEEPIQLTDEEFTAILPCPAPRPIPAQGAPPV